MVKEQRTIFEEEAYQRGYRFVVGIDEAGRGPLAGPVVAAACFVKCGLIIEGVNDSKKISSVQREKLYHYFLEHPNVEFGIGIVDNKRIDEINILQATLEAMQLAIEELPFHPDFLLVDGIHLPPVAIPSRAIIKGDAKSQIIGAASIVAKHKRDELMIAYHEKYPEYGFAQHKGYPTKKHFAAIVQYGPCCIHRRSFRLGSANSC